MRARSGRVRRGSELNIPIHIYESALQRIVLLTLFPRLYTHTHTHAYVYNNIVILFLFRPTANVIKNDRSHGRYYMRVCLREPKRFYTYVRARACGDCNRPTRDMHLKTNESYIYMYYIYEL